MALSYIIFIATHLALNDSIELRQCEVINVEDYPSPCTYGPVINNPEQMTGLEELVQVWCKQIEQVITTWIDNYKNSN